MGNRSKQVFTGKTDTGASEDIDTQGAPSVTLTVQVTAIGATPTATIHLEASPTGGIDAKWVSLGNVVMTTVSTNRVSVSEAHRFVRARVTANTNVTLDASITTAGFASGAWN